MTYFQTVRFNLHLDALQDRQRLDLRETKRLMSLREPYQVVHVAGDLIGDLISALGEALSCKLESVFCFPGRAVSFHAQTCSLHTS